MSGGLWTWEKRVQKGWGEKGAQSHPRDTIREGTHCCHCISKDQNLSYTGLNSVHPSKQTKWFSFQNDPLVAMKGLWNFYTYYLMLPVLCGNDRRGNSSIVGQTLRRRESRSIRYVKTGEHTGQWYQGSRKEQKSLGIPKGAVFAFYGC